ncbi:MAG TPA: MlaD family protein [Alphaproteobacteria bacterium]|nr:MlaD family protein [Alphaproteobacteria bacterium]
METRASYLLVGSFVLLVVVAAFGFVVWIAKGQIVKDTVKYQAYFSTTVTGLQVGSPVRYRGIPAGEVTEIKVSVNDPNLVEVTFEIDKKRKNLVIHQFSTAVLETQGITGVAFIQIKHNEQALQAWRERTGDENGIPDDPPIKKELGARYPTLDAEGSGFEKILTSLPKALNQITELANRASMLLDEENRLAIKNSLANIATMSKRLSESSAGIDTLLKNVNRAVVNIEKAAGDLPPAVNELRAGFKNFGSMSSEIKALVTENRRPFRDFTATGLYEFSLFITEARELVKNLNRVSKRFEGDPSRFLFGNTQKGYKAR